MTYQTQASTSLIYSFAEFGKVAQLIKEQQPQLPPFYKIGDILIDKNMKILVVVEGIQHQKQKWQYFVFPILSTSSLMTDENRYWMTDENRYWVDGEALTQHSTDPDYRSYWAEIYQTEQQHKEEDKPFCYWTLADIHACVKEQGFTVSHEDAIAIRERCEDRWDASSGLTFDDIWEYAAELEDEEDITLSPTE
jgi:hypothetical protein